MACLWFFFINLSLSLSITSFCLYLVLCCASKMSSILVLYLMLLEKKKAPDTETRNLLLFEWRRNIFSVFRFAAAAMCVRVARTTNWKRRDDRQLPFPYWERNFIVAVVVAFVAGHDFMLTRASYFPHAHTYAMHTVLEL